MPEVVFDRLGKVFQSRSREAWSELDQRYINKPINSNSKSKKNLTFPTMGTFSFKWPIVSCFGANFLWETGDFNGQQDHKRKGEKKKTKTSKNKRKSLK